MRGLTKGFGIIGLILILFGVVALAITKLMNWYVYAHLGLGVLLMVLYSIFNFDTFMTRARERSTTEGSKVFVYAAIVMAIVIIVNIISFRKSQRWDLTANKVFTLEEQTLKTLQGLQAPIQVNAYMNAKNAQRDAFKELISAYSYRSSNVHYEIIDPDKKPDLAGRLQVRDGDIRFDYGAPDKILTSYDEAAIKAAVQSKVQSIYYFAAGPDDANYQKLKALLSQPEMKEKNLVVELLKPTMPLPPGVDIKDPAIGNIYIRHAHKDTVVRDVSEEVFTNAILQVARQVTPTVRFTMGHGERSLTNEEEAGYSVLKSAIVNEGYDVKAMETTLVQGVPAGTDVLIIAGAIAPFTKEEVDSLDKYLELGGKLIFLADPILSNPKLSATVSIMDTGLEGLMEKWGTHLGKDILLEKHMQIFAGQTTDPYIVTQNYVEHDVTRPLKERSTLFHVARSVRRSAKASNDLNTIELIKSAPGANNSWAESNLTALLNQKRAEYDEGKDLPGPVSVATVTERTKNNGDGKSTWVTKLAVFGDADFVANQFIRSQEFNYDLFLNTLNWMWGKQEQISIRAKQIRSSKLVLTPQQTNIIFYSAVLTIPELVLLIGLVIYWRRKSR